MLQAEYESGVVSYLFLGGGRFGSEYFVSKFLPHREFVGFWGRKKPDAIRSITITVETIQKEIQPFTKIYQIARAFFKREKKPPWYLSVFFRFLHFVQSEKK